MLSLAFISLCFSGVRFSFHLDLALDCAFSARQEDSDWISSSVDDDEEHDSGMYLSEDDFQVTEKMK